MATPLVERLSSSKPIVVVETLCRLLAEDPEISEASTVGAIIDQLQNADVTVREYAATVICEKVHWTNSIAHLFGDALYDQSPLVREQLLHYLQRISRDETLTNRLLPLLGDSLCNVRVCAARAIWKHSGGLIPVDNIIEDALRSNIPHCICESCFLLCEMGRNGARHLSSLRPLLSASEGSVRGNTLNAISKISEDRELVRTLAKSSENDPDPFVRFLASTIVKQLTP